MTATPENPAGAGKAPLPAPNGAIATLLARLMPVPTECVGLRDATGRVLAEGLIADRPSPACDVSAMDGYAIQRSDVSRGHLPVSGEVAIGQAPPDLRKGMAVRIFTGGAVPPGADAVVKREDVREEAEAIHFRADFSAGPGENIRRRGENAALGAPVAEPGQFITPPVAAALAAFGQAEVCVHRRVRVAVLVTGNELLPLEATPTPWQVRESNGWALAALLRPLPWVELLAVEHVRDELQAVHAALRKALDAADVVLLTGGVSVGDYDFVPAAVQDVGGEIIFHKVALRPGKPLLGAVGPRGQAILGLPGNPVAALTTARRWAAPVLRRRAGCSEPQPAVPVVTLTHGDAKQLPLWWYRPVRVVGSGQAELIATKGSGDLAATACTDGFVEVPPHATGPGPWPYFSWSIS